MFKIKMNFSVLNYTLKIVEILCNLVSLYSLMFVHDVYAPRNPSG